ncbi:FKBP-type peptidyl-prolyl cis-trans isomerase [Serratia sp. L9]
MVVPPTLAYGDKGLPPDIPPGSTMVYNVKILDVVAPADTISPVN